MGGLTSDSGSSPIFPERIQVSESEQKAGAFGTTLGSDTHRKEPCYVEKARSPAAGL